MSEQTDPVAARKRVESLFRIRASGDYAFGTIVAEPNPDAGSYTILVAIYSSCGNYGYCWQSAGGEPAEFLKDMSRDYAMEKMAGQDVPTKVINDRATTEALFKDVAETFADDPERREKARGEVQTFMTENSWRSVNEFLDLAFSGLCPFPYSHPTDIPYVTEMAPNMVRFWEVLWPEILKVVEHDFTAADGEMHKVVYHAVDGALKRSLPGMLENQRQTHTHVVTLAVRKALEGGAA